MMNKKPLLLFSVLLSLPAVSRAAFNFFNPEDTNSIPGTLSQTGVYSNILTKTPDTALKYFEVNAPLWSDGADKMRWIVLPPGKHITYIDTTDLFDYPDGTRFVKLFRQERVLDDSTTRVYWETRILVNKENAQGYDQWYGFSYKWNADATEATRVNPGEGFDTVFYHFPRGTSNPQSYKKWHFPSKSQCNLCHQSSQGYAGGNDPVSSRGVLGFFPAQLKRPAPLQPGINQINYLFNQGVFTGTPPTSIQLTRRWKGIHEPIPSGVSANQRFAIIDTMARSYIAANCSGCHGTRGIPVTPQIPSYLNYDFFNLRPVMEFAYKGTAFWGLQGLDPDPLTGRNRYISSIAKAGLDTSAEAVWNMALPPGNSSTTYPSLVYPGHPSFSTLAYRIAARSAPWFDSANTRNDLTRSDPEGRLAWIFSQPWGSVPWRNLMAQHNLDINSSISYFYDNQQMPPIATYMPDTAGLKILGEWIRNYRTLYVVDSGTIVTSLKAASVLPRDIPLVMNRILRVPDGWEGKAQMIGIQGRIHDLSPGGKRRYIIPQTVPTGVYFFRVGNRYFKASVF